MNATQKQLSTKLRNANLYIKELEDVAGITAENVDLYKVKSRQLDRVIDVQNHDYQKIFRDQQTTIVNLKIAIIVLATFLTGVVMSSIL